ncbi:MAG: class I SAM-dependent methyltransferase [Vallitalea sp.]|jgi:2-polyprenyl-3-methyl-5-hydroxy-6-metoxy-1,4-benzoquinol methylase|nr:class I SAM-dependent methyltransferase [Vallitalea sp.]
MSFYKSISKAYDNIFPINENIVEFVLESISNENKFKILDIGCATGHLAGELSKKGFSVMGIDLNSEMIKFAKNHYKTNNVDFKVMNMLDVDEKFQEDSFDIITCFGNTLVHLTNEEMIFKALRKIKCILKNGGKLQIQILNYDYILNECIKELPLIENDYIKFERFYSEQVRDERLIFETRLTIKSTGEVISNEIYLYPLLKKQLNNMLQQLGFEDVKFYKDFKKRTYTNNHLPLVMESVLSKK